VVAGAFEMMDDRIYDEKELQKLLPVAVISEIPALASAADEHLERRRLWLGWVTAALVSADFAGVGPQLLCAASDITSCTKPFTVEAQSVRDHSRSFVPVSDPEAQRSFGGSLLRGPAAQRIRGLNRRGGNRKNPSAALPAAIAEAERRRQVRLRISTDGSRRSSSCSTLPAISGLPAAGKNKSELLLQLANYVVSRGEKKLTTVLVVDEAHHLSTDILEEIRLLTNLETADEKLLQILLVGQPELDEKLDSVELRQLKQRIALRSHLAVARRERNQGLHRAPAAAGGQSRAASLFPPETVAAVHRHSGGIPRLINTICENALIAAYARQAACVTPDIIDAIAKDFRLGVHTPQKKKKKKTPANSTSAKAAKTLLELYTPTCRASKRGRGRGTGGPGSAGGERGI
jgi:hypothetical protein